MANRRRFFSRNKPQPLIASGHRVDISDERAIQAVLERRTPTQQRAWDIYDAVGEVKMAVNILASLLSRITIYAAELPKDKDATPQRTSNDLAVDTVERLGTPTQRADLQRELAVHLLVPGEGYLIGLQPGPKRDNDTEIWEMASIDEMEKADRTVKLLGWNDDGTDVILNATSDPPDTWIRIWRQHARKRQRADSHVMSILGAADELIWWDGAAIAAAQNRMTLAGLVGLRDDLEVPAESDEEAQLDGSSRFIKRFMETVSRAIQNPGTAEGAVPILYTFPDRESGSPPIVINEFTRPQDELLQARTEQALRRIAQGLNIPVEDIFGLGEATHWGGGQIEEGKFRQFIEPLAVLLVNALTNAYFHPILRDGGVDPSKFVIWYDASNLVTYPDRTTQSNRGLELGAINWEAWRRINGYTGADAPTPEEMEKLLIWLSSVRRGSSQKGIVPDPDKPEDPDDPSAPPQENSPGKRTPVEQPAAPLRRKGQDPLAASSNGHTSLGRKLAEIDTDLLSRVQVMCDSAMHRALEKAGNTLKNKSNKNPSMRASLRNVSPEDVAATLGREKVIALGMDDLFTDSFDRVPELFTRWCDSAADASLHLADIDPSAKSAAPFELASYIDEAAQSLVTDLREHAAVLIFDRAASLVAAPEADDLLVPVCIPRRALSHAGGCPSGEMPNLLLATGRAVAKTLAEAGYYAETYEWWYVPSARKPYAAHQNLDGHQFKIEGAVHLPGELGHCRCMSVPVFQI